MSKKLEIVDVASLLKTEFSSFKEELNNNLDERLEKIKKEIVQEVNKSLEQANKKIKDLEVEVVTLKEKLAETVKEKETEKETNEIKARKNNIIIGNIKEQEGENVKDIVLNFLENNVKVSITSKELNFVRRIGKITGSVGGNRPILVGLISHLKKEEIFSNIKNIENTNCYIKGDFTYKQREKRARLIKTKSELEKQDKKVVLKSGKLIVEDYPPVTVQDVTSDPQKRIRSPEDPVVVEADNKKIRYKIQQIKPTENN